nr:hypothetical protein [Tanacetum cinerariifolium]GFB90059.1 hypothetical protein [Tanacetum cinerariifolium]
MLKVRAVDMKEEVQIPAQDDAVQENVTKQVAADVGTSQTATDVAPPTSPLPPSPIIPSTPPHQLPKDVENVFNQGRKSVDMETDEGIKLEEDTKVQEVVEVVNAAKLITEVVTAAATATAAVSAPVPATKPAAKTKVLKIDAALAVSTRKRKGVVIRDPEEELHKDTPAETYSVKDKGKGILIEDLKPMKKKDQLAMDAEYAKKLQEELEKEHEIEKEHEEAYKQIDWNAAFEHVQAKETRYIKRYHGFKKKP